MTRLTFDMRRFNRIIINGCEVSVHRGNLTLHNQARFMVGKQIMDEKDAQTPLQKIYYCIQQEYIHGETDRETFLNSFNEYAETADDADYNRLLDAEGHLRSKDYYGALKIIRDLIRCAPT